MSLQDVKIQLTGDANRILAGLKTFPPRLASAIAEAMNAVNQQAISNIQRNHLTGIGPFPVEQHRLGIKSTNLLHSVHASDAVIGGGSVTSGIGSNVGYARIHEIGGVIHRKARETAVRLKTDANGNLVRQAGYAHLAMFARKGNKRVKEVKASVPAYDISMPARAPFMTGIREVSTEYAKAFSLAITQTWNQN